MLGVLDSTLIRNTFQIFIPSTRYRHHCFDITRSDHLDSRHLLHRRNGMRLLRLELWLVLLVACVVGYVFWRIDQALSIEDYGIDGGIRPSMDAVVSLREGGTRNHAGAIALVSDGELPHSRGEVVALEYTIPELGIHQNSGLPMNADGDARGKSTAPATGLTMQGDLVNADDRMTLLSTSYSAEIRSVGESVSADAPFSGQQAVLIQRNLGPVLNANAGAAGTHH